MKKISLFLALLLLLQSCIFYQRYPMAKSRLPRIDRSNLVFYVLDAARPESRVWYVSEAEFQQDQMRGFLVRVGEDEAREVATIRNNRDAKQSRDEVLLYAKPRYALALGDTINTTIAYDQLEKIEVHEVNAGKSVALSLLLAFFSPFVFLGALFSTVE